MNEKATVLVVEDNRATRDGILSFLRDEGYLAVGAENGKRALELIDKIGPPNLILLDLMMPVMDGWQFLAQRRAAGRSDCPVVLLSGLPYIQDAPGVADFLSKPIRFEKLRACLERYCAPSSARG
jgi:CheY-like chemotaxis protein